MTARTSAALALGFHLMMTSSAIIVGAAVANEAVKIPRERIAAWSAARIGCDGRIRCVGSRSTIAGWPETSRIPPAAAQNRVRSRQGGRTLAV